MKKEKAEEKLVKQVNNQLTKITNLDHEIQKFKFQKLDLIKKMKFDSEKLFYQLFYKLNLIKENFKIYKEN